MTQQKLIRDVDCPLVKIPNEYLLSYIVTLVLADTSATPTSPGPAPPDLLPVAVAGYLPTATKRRQNSYTSPWDTTKVRRLLTAAWC